MNKNWPGLLCRPYTQWTYIIRSDVDCFHYYDKLQRRQGLITDTVNMLNGIKSSLWSITRWQLACSFASYAETNLQLIAKDDGLLGPEAKAFNSGFGTKRGLLFSLSFSAWHCREFSRSSWSLEPDIDGVKASVDHLSCYNWTAVKIGQKP